MSSVNRNLNQKDLFSIVRGSCFLGSGGGGAYATGMQLAQHFQVGSYYIRDRVDCIPIQALEDCVDYGVIVAYMGAPEKMAVLEYPVAAELAVQKALEAKGIASDKRVCIVPVEIGPISSVVACLVAARLGFPVLDADGAGRAVPTLELCTFSQGVSVNPTIIASQQSGQYIELNISQSDSDGAASKIESLARPILGMPEFDQMAGLAMWVMDRQQIEKLVLPGTLSLCQALGELLASQQVFVPAILEFFEKQTWAQGYQAKIVFEGLLRSASSSTQGGFDHGQVEIDLPRGNTGVVVFQNESLILWDSAQTAPLVTAPNLIAYLIPDQAPYVFTNADIMEGDALKPELLGKKITVMALQAPQKLTESEAHLHQKRLKILQQVGAQSTLPSNYKSKLAELGYHGCLVPFS